MTHRLLAVLSLVAVIGLSVAPARVDAATLELTPVVAHLAPTNSQVANSDAPLVIRQSALTAYGARLTWWVAPRIGIEAAMLVGSSNIELISGGQLSLGAQMFQADARVRFRLNDPSASTSFYFIGGFGLSDLGDGLSDVGEDLGIKTPAKFGGVLGIGASMAVSDRVRLRFDVEDHIHKSNFEIDEANFGFPIESRTQHDLVFALGLVFPVWE